MIKYFKLLHTFNGSKHFVILLKKLLRANRVIRNALVFKNKALQFNNSMAWSLIQIIFMFGFNCCVAGGQGTGRRIHCSKWEDSRARLGLLNPHSSFSFPSTNYAKFFVEIQQADFHLPPCQSAVLTD